MFTAALQAQSLLLLQAESHRKARNLVFGAVMIVTLVLLTFVPPVVVMAKARSRNR